jgi:endonuclease-3
MLNAGCAGVDGVTIRVAKKKLIAGEKLEAEQKRMAEILRVLKREYPESQCSLVHKTPFQLLIATILSAQCTDERVNQVTPELFRRYPGPEEMAKAKIGDLEKLVQTTGFFRSKAKSLLEASQSIMELHDGKVPMELDQLVQLRGVGRKTANVVLGVAFGVPGLVVDTHVKRLSARFGFTKSVDPIKIEQEMMKIVVKEDWSQYAHLLIDHGRAICTARKAKCEECVISRLCAKVGVARVA